MQPPSGSFMKLIELSQNLDQITKVAKNQSICHTVIQNLGSSSSPSLLKSFAKHLHSSKNDGISIVKVGKKEKSMIYKKRRSRSPFFTLFNELETRRRPQGTTTKNHRILPSSKPIVMAAFPYPSSATSDIQNICQLTP